MSETARTAPEAAASDRRQWLAEQFDLLRRWFEGRFVAEAGPSDEVVSAESLLAGDRLEAVLVDNYQRQDYSRVRLGAAGSHAERHLQVAGIGLDRGLGVAASRLTRHYCAPLTTVALAGLSAGIGFDLSPRQCAMVLDDGLPFRLVLGKPPEPPALLAVLDGVNAPPHVPRVEGIAELRTLVWRSLYGDHLAPLFRHIGAATRITLALMWTNAAEWVANIHDSALEYLDDQAGAPLVAECRALLAAASLPGVDDHGNPLQDRIDWVAVTAGDGRSEVQTRRHCCLTYLLADRFGRLCGTCPYLKPEDRLALAQERHAVRMGTPGGAAEERALAQGLERPSIAAILASAQPGR